MFTRKSGVQKERCVFIYLILTKCKWTVPHWREIPVGYITGYRRVMRNLFRTAAHNIVSSSGGDCYFWRLSVDSHLTDTPIRRTTVKWTPRVVPCFSLLPVYKTDISLLDGHMVRGQRCPSQRERERVNCTMVVFSLCDFMRKPSLSAIHRIILAACSRPVMNIYTDFKNCS